MQSKHALLGRPLELSQCTNIHNCAGLSYSDDGTHSGKPTVLSRDREIAHFQGRVGKTIASMTEHHQLQYIFSTPDSPFSYFLHFGKSSTYCCTYKCELATLSLHHMAASSLLVSQRSFEMNGDLSLCLPSPCWCECMGRLCSILIPSTGSC